MIVAFVGLLILSGTNDGTFANLADGRRAIDADVDYFNQLQPLEMAAKTGLVLPPGSLAQQRAVCRERYRNGVREFTLREQEVLGSATATIDAAIAKDYPLYATTPWRFLKTADFIEGGMPHTRGPYIVLSEGVCRDIADPAALRGAKAGPMPELIGLLLHEKMHVVQRQHAEIFDDLYTRHWGLIKASRIADCPWLVEHHLVNPDGPDCCWVFPMKHDGKTTYIWPLVTLSDGSGAKKMPEDFRLSAIHVSPSGDGFKVETADDGKPVADDLEGVAAYREAIPGTTNNYHPNEALADLFTQVVVADYFTPGKAEHSGGADVASLRAWCREHLRPASKRI